MDESMIEYLGALYYICKNLFPKDQKQINSKSRQKNPHLLHDKFVICEFSTHLSQWSILILGKNIKTIVFLRSTLKNYSTYHVFYKSSQCKK
jgi:hypothetical protein